MLDILDLALMPVAQQVGDSQNRPLGHHTRGIPLSGVIQDHHFLRGLSHLGSASQVSWCTDCLVVAVFGVYDLDVQVAHIQFDVSDLKSVQAPLWKPLTTTGEIMDSAVSGTGNTCSWAKAANLHLRGPEDLIRASG